MMTYIVRAICDKHLFQHPPLPLSSGRISLIAPAITSPSPPSSRLPPFPTLIPPPPDPSRAKPVQGKDSGGGASLRRGLEAWLPVADLEQGASGRHVRGHDAGHAARWPARLLDVFLVGAKGSSQWWRITWPVGCAIPRRGGDGGPAGEAGEDATIDDGARGCLNPHWRRWWGCVSLH
jgi:hypothetical protein